jgi:hypothetical protein
MAAQACILIGKVTPMKAKYGDQVILNCVMSPGGELLLRGAGDEDVCNPNPCAYCHYLPQTEKIPQKHMIW